MKTFQDGTKMLNELQGLGVMGARVPQLHLLECSLLNKGRRSKGWDCFYSSGYSESLCHGYRGKMNVLEVLGEQSRSHLLFAHHFVLGHLTGAPEESME